MRTPELALLAGRVLPKSCQAECEFGKITLGQLAAAWWSILYMMLPNSTLFLGLVQLSRGSASSAESWNSQLQDFSRVFMCVSNFPEIILPFKSVIIFDALESQMKVKIKDMEVFHPGIGDGDFFIFLDSLSTSWDVQYEFCWLE